MYDTLHDLCNRNGCIAGAVGIDQGITTLEALDFLCQFSSDSTIVCTRSNYIYHPKLYLVEGDKWACAVVGSANLTRDGLNRNVELATSPPMAKETVYKEDMLNLFKQGVVVWNQWRKEHPELQPDLSGTDLRGATLRKVDFRVVNLNGADLSETFLAGADLGKADLRNAQLRNASLYRANLSGADLQYTFLSKANLFETKLTDVKIEMTAFYQSIPEANLCEEIINRAK